MAAEGIPRCAQVRDMRAYHAEPDGHKAHEIAARQRHIVTELMPRACKRSLRATELLRCRSLPRFSLGRAEIRLQGQTGRPPSCSTELHRAQSE
jgi:hypothetical protein